MLQAQPGQGDALAQILLEAARLVSSAPGCHVYLISTDEAHPDGVWVTEAWDSKEAHDESLKDEAVRALIGKAMPLLAGAPAKGQTLTILGGLGVPSA